MIFFRFTLQTLIISLLSLCLAASAGPCMPCQASNRRDPWGQRLPSRGDYTSPRITNPTNNAIWSSGSDVVVTWEVRNLADNNSHLKGTLLLGYLEAGSADKHLNTEHPLASDFNLHDGFTTFKCPKVEPRKDYIVVLMGNSGNPSPTFTIRQ